SLREYVDHGLIVGARSFEYFISTGPLSYCRSIFFFFFFFSSRRRHTRWPRDWSSDVCSSDLRRARRARHVAARGPLRPSRHERHRRSAGAAVPQAVIDSHTHLDACAPPDEELVAAAVQAGVTRMVTIGTDGASSRRALQAAEAFPQVYAAVG